MSPASVGDVVPADALGTGVAVIASRDMPEAAARPLSP
jgi:CxxC motif-containing protein